MLTLKDKVLHCLSKYPETRNSDIKLMNAVWIEYHNSKVFLSFNRHAVYLTDLYELPREDHIKRVRAVIQNIEKKFLPTSLEVAKKRKIKEQEWRDYIQYENAILTNPGY